MSSREAKHTPGPWDVMRDRHNHFGMIEVVGSGLNIVGFTVANDVSAAQAEMKVRDAYLIAAAPQLLETCKAVLDAINRADLGGKVLWIEPPYQLAEIHETASEALEAVISIATKG